MTASGVSVRQVCDEDVDELVVLAHRNARFHGHRCVLPTDATGWSDLADSSDQVWFTVRSSTRVAGVLVLARWAGPPWCCAELGAGVDRRIAGSGVMAEALRQLVRWAFGPGGLQRVEALIEPSNTASMRFVSAGGLRFEAMARGALDVGGHRADVQRWAVIASDLDCAGP